MTFEEILDQAIAMLQRRGRLTYGTLKRQFQLDDAALEDLKNELIEGQRLAVDERGNVLVWTGDTASGAAPATAPALAQAQAPLTYTPAYLVEKILTTRSALEGERKQVTVLFADLKGSTAIAEASGDITVRAMLKRYHDLCGVSVRAHGGTLVKTIGDGSLSHFTDALNACRAAADHRPARFAR